MIMQAPGVRAAFIIRDWAQRQLKHGRDTRRNLLKQNARATREFHGQSLPRSVADIAVTIKVPTQQVRKKLIGSRWKRCCQTLIHSDAKRYQAIDKLSIHYGENRASVRVDRMIRLKNSAYLFEDGGIHA